MLTAIFSTLKFVNTFLSRFIIFIFFFRLSQFPCLDSTISVEKSWKSDLFTLYSVHS